MSHRLVSPPLARTVSSQTGSHHMQMSHTLIALVTCAQVFRGNIRPAPGFQCSRSSWYYLASSSRQHVPAQSTSRIGSTTQRLPDVFLSPSTPTLCGNSASTVTKAAQRVARGAVFASLASVTANLAGSAPTVLPLSHHELHAGFGAGSILSTTLVFRTAPMAPQSFPRGGGVSHKPPRRASGRPTRRDASETLASRTVAGGSSVW